MINKTIKHTIKQTIKRYTIYSDPEAEMVQAESYIELEVQYCKTQLKLDWA